MTIKNVEFPLEKENDNEDNSTTQTDKVGTISTITAPGRVSDVHYSSCVSPTVSVIVPIYNAEYTLREALDSVLNHQPVSLELVLVDDCSTDDSSKIIEEYADAHKNITVVKHKKNAGYGAAMNDGINAAKGTWLAILEPDDYIEPAMYSSMLNNYLNGVDIIKTPYIREVRTVEGTKRGDGPVEYLECSYKGRIKPITQPFMMNDPGVSHLLRHHPSIWSAIYRREFIINSKIRFVEYPGAGWADNEFFYETLLRASKIAYLDRGFYVYREETDAEYEKFAKANKMLPLERWQSMQDIIERINVKSEDIKRSHVSKGFTYLGGLLDANGWDDEELLEEADRMFARMDPKLVAKESKINPKLKALYAERTGNSADSNAFIKLKYYCGLASEFVYTIKTNGLDYTIKKVKKVIS